jgi:mannose-6-phosphate isomerase
VQQNSDTTYRVFDWNRVGLDGKPRQLHVAESLCSIDFEDFEPKLIEGQPLSKESPPARRLVADKLFTVDLVEAGQGSIWSPKPAIMQILGLLAGQVQVRGGETEVSLKTGQFCLLAAGLRGVQIEAPAACKMLRIFAGAN